MKYYIIILGEITYRSSSILGNINSKLVALYCKLHSKTFFEKVDSTSEALCQKQL